jgi:hypothetical protein
VGQRRVASRRDFLVSAGMAGLVAPTLVRGTMPCPAPSANLNGGKAVTTACTAVDAMTDWLARVNAPGVVWYQGFLSDAEVNQFRWATGAKGNDPNATAPDDGYLTRSATGGPGGTFPYMQITRLAGREVDCNWWRPFSPLAGAGNGKGTDDPAAGGTVPLQTWAPTQGGNQLNSWTSGWYSNDAGSDGSDFYLQIRVMVDPRRSASGMPPAGKMNYITICPYSYCGQEVVTYSNGASTGGGPNYFRMYNFSPPLEQEDTLGRPGQQVGATIANYSAGIYCDVGTQPKYCWAWSGGWDTVLYHLTPPNPATSGVAGIQVFVAHQGETTYTKVWDEQWKAQGFDMNHGWQALLLNTYANNQVCPTDFWQRWAQLIFSKQFIACPQV